MAFLFIAGDDMVDAEYQLLTRGKETGFSIQVSGGEYWVNEMGTNRTGLWMKTLGRFRSLNQAKRFCLHVAKQ